MNTDPNAKPSADFLELLRRYKEEAEKIRPPDNKYPPGIPVPMPGQKCPFCGR